MGDKEKSVIGANLKFLRKEKNMTQEELAKALEIGRHSIGSYEEGRAEPKIETLLAITELFKIPIEVFVKEDLALLSDAEINAIRGDYKTDIEGRNLRILTISLDKQGKELIQVVNQKAAAGYLNGYADPEYMESLPTFNLPFPTFTNGTFRAFEVAGDSMLPIKQGAYIIGEFVESWRDIKDGSIYVVVSNNEGVVLKRVSTRINRDDTGSLYLKSDNPQYSPYEVEISDVKEIWKARAYISHDLPDPDMSLERLSSIVMDLQNEMIKMKGK
ncbi:MAG: helix-turn-helix domain-containing protein [Bacteroidia bacterium]